MAFLQSFLIFCILTSSIRCSSNKNEYPSPPGYDLRKPYAYKLPSVLDEISGVLYYPKDSSIFAIQDEKGFLFKIHLGSPLKIDQWKFSTGGDYEDIALVDSTFYVLKSKGALEKFKFSSGDSISLEIIKLFEGKGNEFESLYYDSSIHQLILVCKNCDADKKGEVSAWSFDPATDSSAAAFVINASGIKRELDDDKLKLKPSAAAIHPLTGELYLVSSVNKLIVVLNKDHSIKNVYPIDPKLFKQPEGMTFTPKGDLIISNEAGSEGSADILFFQYNKSNNRQ